MRGFELLELEGLNPFGVGGRRECYVHPFDENRCVKVLRKDERRTVRLKKFRLVPGRFRREYDNNAHEYKVLMREQHRLGAAACEHLPHCYGYEDTDLGPGLVLDLIRDADGLIGRSLRQLFTEGHGPDEFKTAFDAFSRFLLDYTVLTRSLLDHNLIARKCSDGSWKIYMIDGFGDPAWISLAGWSKFLARRKIRRRISAAWDRFEVFYRSGGVSKELLENSSWDQGMLRFR